MNLVHRIVTVALLLTGVVGCSADEPRETEAPAAESTTEPSGDSSAAPDGATRPYAVRLALPEERSGSPDEEETSGASTSLVVEVENAGRRADRYLLRLLPPGVGGVIPESFRLAAGERRPVRVMLSSSAAETPLELVAVSRGAGEVLASLDLTP